MRPQMETSKDPRDGYEPLLREALQLYPNLIKTEPPVREGYRGVTHLAHGWYLR